MGLTVDVSLDIPGLKKIIEQKRKLIWENIVTVVRTEAASALVDKIMVGYDRLAGISDQLPEDPTGLSKWREEFKRSLEEDIQRTIRPADNTLKFQIGDKEFLGYTQGEGNPRDDTPLVWMVFYIEGLAGDWGFITPELYNQLRGPGTYQATWGRFGQGFLINKTQFEEEGWGQVTSFEQIRHPFSGFSPVDIFREAIDEFKLRPFIEKAIKAAAAGRVL